MRKSGNDQRKGQLTRMTTITCTPWAHRAVSGLSVGLAVALLSGCGDSAGPSTGPAPAVTVTASPSPPPTLADRAATGSTRVAKSDDVGRKFDLGTIVRTEEDDGLPVVIFDRWTARGVADSTVADKGVPIGVHSDGRYQNLNSKITFRIPVAQGAIFTYRHCVAVDQPPEQKPSTLEDFARLKNPENVILLTLDQHGRVFSAQNDPAC